MVFAPWPDWFYSNRTGTDPRPAPTGRRQVVRRPSGLLVSGADSPPACGTTSTSSRRGSPVGCCCRGFGCKDGSGKKKTPLSMGFVGSLGSSCPYGGSILRSGTMTAASATCADRSTGRDCSNYLQSFCGFGWSWNIDPADAFLPGCGAYIAGVALACVTLPTPYGLTYACPHQKVNRPGGSTCAWLAVMDVYRTDLVPRAILCTAGNHPKQAADCSWSCVAGTAPYECFAGCPKCTVGCPPCPPTIGHPGNCCGPGDCDGAWTALGCVSGGSSVQCGVAPAAGCIDDCGTIILSRRYQFIFAGCANGGYVKGCNPICCPPDTDNFGDFAMQMAHYPVFDGMGNLIDVIPLCPDDWLQVFCP